MPQEGQLESESESGLVSCLVTMSHSPLEFALMPLEFCHLKGEMDEWMGQMEPVLDACPLEENEVSTRGKG